MLSRNGPTARRVYSYKRRQYTTGVTVEVSYRILLNDEDRKYSLWAAYRRRSLLPTISLLWVRRSAHVSVAYAGWVLCCVVTCSGVELVFGVVVWRVLWGVDVVRRSVGRTLCLYGRLHSRPGGRLSTLRLWVTLS